MASTRAAYRNSCVSASGKVRPGRFSMSEAMVAACRLVKSLGLVPSFRNLYVIELAIRAESQFSSITIREAADRIIAIGRIALQMGECLNYFWFEDACWRNPKLSFKERDDLRMRREAAVGASSYYDSSPEPAPKCAKCLDLGSYFPDGSNHSEKCPDCDACWRCKSTREIRNYNDPNKGRIPCPDCQSAAGGA
jgi:hypothetical protein